MQDITHARVLKIALPIVLSNMTVPIVGLVDTGVVGQMGQAAPIGAVGIGATILTAFYWVFGFLRMGTTGLVGQAIGRGEHAEVSALLSRGLLIGGIAGAAIIALQTPLFELAFWTSPATDQVEGLAQQYMSIRVWSAPALIALYAVTGWLIAREKTVAVLVLQLWINGLNVGLDVWFVLGLEWGVKGVAFATFIAEWSGLALGLFLCRSGFQNAAWRDKAAVFNAARLIAMAKVNGNILLRSLMLQSIFVSFIFLGADFGDVTLAANHILLLFLEVTAFALDGFAFAAEALVAKAMGAGRVTALRRASLLSSFWGLICVIGLAIGFAALGGAIIDTMTTAADVRSGARVYLWYLVASPIVGLAAWMLDGIFIGATRSADMRNMMAVSLAIYVAAVLLLLPVLGNHGLWLAMLISFIARGLTLGLRYPALERAANNPQ